MTDRHARKITVAHGKNYRVSGGSIGGVDSYLDDDECPTVILAAMPKPEGGFTDHHLHEGDTFELGPGLWQVTEIKRPNSPRWAAVLTQLR